MAFPPQGIHLYFTPVRERRALCKCRCQLQGRSLKYLPSKRGLSVARSSSTLRRCAPSRLITPLPWQCQLQQKWCSNVGRAEVYRGIRTSAGKEWLGNSRTPNGQAQHGFGAPGSVWGFLKGELKRQCLLILTVLLAYFWTHRERELVDAEVLETQSHREGKHRPEQ